MDMGAGASRLPATRPGVVVTLDALGTIYKFREPITTQYIKVAQRCGVKAHIDEDALSKAFRRTFKDLSTEFPNYGKGNLASPRAWWKTVVNDSFRQVVNESDIPDHLGDMLYDRFKSSAAYELYPDVKPFFASLRELKQQWSKPDDPPIFVGVISNSDPRVKSVLQSLGLRIGIDKAPSLENIKDRAGRIVSDRSDIMKSPWHDAYSSLNDVDFLVTSYEAGAEKPDTGIFDFAFHLGNVNYMSKLEQQREDWGPSFKNLKIKLQLPKQVATFRESKFIHIGDDYAKDYQGAEASMFEAIHLARKGEADEEVQAANTVTDLEQAAIAVRMLANQQLHAPGE